jgi:predicted DNA-binding ribbon-helix-helix protein
VSPHPPEEAAVPRTTITLSDERYRALKQAAARRGLTITEVVDQALELAGVNTRESVMQMLAEAGRRSGLTEEQAMRLAVEETRAERAERAAERRA